MTMPWRRLAPGALCVLLAAAPSAAADTRVVFTVDVESNERLRLPDQINAVCEDGSACGLMEIVRLLQARRWPGTFFLDVYEHRQFGETALRNIAVGLQNAGQDVALHTHPHWAYDPARWAMHQYTVDEQTTIVRDGIRLLQEWTGRPVVAHRAGAYTADERTLIALQRNGVLIDSSLLWRYPENRLGGLGLARNLPSRSAGVVEIPVTAYERGDAPRSLGRVLGPVTAIRKIDPNWFVDADEARSAIGSVLAANVPVLVVFLHSFSFMNAAAGSGPAVADRHAMEMFNVIVDQVASRGLRVVTMRELAEGLTPMPASDHDIVPRVAVPVDLSRYLWHRVKGSGGLSWSVAAAIVSLCAWPMFVVARRRQAKKRTARESGPRGTSAALSGVQSR